MLDLTAIWESAVVDKRNDQLNQQLKRSLLKAYAL
jgi:hypothetical protein